MITESITQDNVKELAELMTRLWPECSYQDEYGNCLRILKANDEICYLVKFNDEYVGFIYLSLRRDYVEGATIQPVAYIEGIFVNKEFRRKGIGRLLVKSGESWAKTKGCKQYASDTELTNVQSIYFHKIVGFKEVNRVVNFVKEV